MHEFLIWPLQRYIFHNVVWCIDKEKERAIGERKQNTLVKSSTNPSRIFNYYSYREKKGKV